MAGESKRTGLGGGAGANRRQLHQADVDNRRNLTIDIPDSQPAEPARGAMWAVPTPGSAEFALRLFDGAKVLSMAGGPPGPAGPEGPQGPPGSGVSFTGGTYVPTILPTAFTGDGTIPQAITLGSGGATAGHFWAGGGWCYVHGTITWGTRATVDAGYGAWVISLPAAQPRWSLASHPFLGMGFWDDGANGGPGTPRFYPLTAAIRHGGVGGGAITLYSEGIEVGGTNAASDPPNSFSAQPNNLNNGTRIHYSIWYRTAA